jgi:hypothetical protein
LNTIAPTTAHLLLGMDSTDLCVLITDLWFLLFFFALASKFQQLLITTYAINTNRIQREFLFNNCIQSQNTMSASKHLLQKTNFPKLSFLCALCVCAVTSRGQEGRVGDGGAMLVARSEWLTANSAAICKNSQDFARFTIAFSLS